MEGKQLKLELISNDDRKYWSGYQKVENFDGNFEDWKIQLQAKLTARQGADKITAILNMYGASVGLDDPLTNAVSKFRDELLEASK